MASHETIIGSLVASGDVDGLIQLLANAETNPRDPQVASRAELEAALHMIVDFVGRPGTDPTLTLMPVLLNVWRSFDEFSRMAIVLGAVEKLRAMLDKAFMAPAAGATQRMATMQHLKVLSATSYLCDCRFDASRCLLRRHLRGDAYRPFNVANWVTLHEVEAVNIRAQRHLGIAQPQEMFQGQNRAMPFAEHVDTLYMMWVAIEGKAATARDGILDGDEAAAVRAQLAPPHIDELEESLGEPFDTYHVMAKGSGSNLLLLTSTEFEGMSEHADRLGAHCKGRGHLCVEVSLQQNVTPVVNLHLIQDAILRAAREHLKTSDLGMSFDDASEAGFARRIAHLLDELRGRQDRRILLLVKDLDLLAFDGDTPEPSGLMALDQEMYSLMTGDRRPLIVGTTLDDFHHTIASMVVAPRDHGLTVAPRWVGEAHHVDLDAMDGPGQNITPFLLE